MRRRARLTGIGAGPHSFDVAFEFDTSAGLGQVADELVCEELRTLRAGADLATDRLL